MKIDQQPNKTLNYPETPRKDDGDTLHEVYVGVTPFW